MSGPIDTHGHECAFYDTALLYPLNAVQLGCSGDGVAVYDMSDPSHPMIGLYVVT